MRLLPGKTIISDDYEHKPITQDNFLKYVFSEPISEIKGWTLRDLLEYIEPYGELFGEMAWCHYGPFRAELDKPATKSDFVKNIEYIGLKRICEIDAETGLVNEYIDVTGMNDTITDEQIDEAFKKDYNTDLANRYAIEFTPVNELAHLEVRIDETYEITKDLNVQPWKEYLFKGKKKFYMLEVIHALLWEISFCGTPDDRDERKEDLEERVLEVKEGTYKSIPWEDAKIQLEQSIWHHSNNREGTQGAD